SPLAGIVVEVRVAPGEEVRASQVLLVIESMKMNNELTAARAGRVTRVAVRPGERVERGAPLIQIE
ncbi:MAG: acetyl-CoA carboxylase biotin carboxyl carrier protein subunit, partial [Chloroflexota bacterium]